MRKFRRGTQPTVTSLSSWQEAEEIHWLAVEHVGLKSWKLQKVAGTGDALEPKEWARWSQEPQSCEVEK